MVDAWAVVILTSMVIVWVINELKRDDEEFERDPNRYWARHPELRDRWRHRR